ncbi:phage tail tape measure protein [Methylobrevis sp. L22]|uniref:Phage tail tape measure protein n=1 Tax=Methylobrevis albus TaxID=2793297 RepID=A0A931I1J8_9HYPH|nr:phage tail tape measure protein [Methylobrevis albus]
MAGEATALRAVLGDLDGLSERFGANLARALAGAVVQGRSLDGVLKQLALSLSSSLLNQALAPLTGALTGLLGNLLGGAASSVMPFAAGGVIAAPTYFPLPGGGTGLAGEAGPEAIVPLARGSDGRLGIRGAAGGGTVSVTFNVTTPDAESFRRSEGQLTAMLARAAARGRRGL